jgi:poly(A) polymerase
MLALREETVKIGLKPRDRLLLEQIGDFFTRQETDAYLVGGFWRDLFLNRPTADIDIITSADASLIAPRLAQHLVAKYITLDKIRGIYRLILPTPEGETGRHVDIATMVEGLEENLTRRDFTINAIAAVLNTLPLKEESPQDIKLLDPLGGLKDLKSKTIRVASEQAFSDDPLRLLRAVRLGAELGFNITPHTEELIKKESQLIKNVAGERVREELLRLFNLADCEGLWLYIDGLGLVSAVFPEMEECRLTSQSKEHLWNVLDHSIRTIDTLDFLLRKGSWRHVSTDVLKNIVIDKDTALHLEQTVSGTSTRRGLIKLAALLHDIAKPKTKALNDKGRIRFIGHPIEGEEMAAQLLKRLRFSTREVKMVSSMVKNHLRPVQISPQGQMPTQRAVYRYFRDTHDSGIETLYLSLADHLATRGAELENDFWQYHISLVNYIAEHQKKQEVIKAKTKLVKGTDIINRFSLRPGPRIKELLEKTEEARVAGDIRTKKEAFDLIAKMIKNSGMEKDK